MQSLKQFKTSKEEMKNVNGGLYVGALTTGVYKWNGTYNTDGTHTGDIATYVDGIKTGTDGYED